jgi:hypothetical protein
LPYGFVKQLSPFRNSSNISSTPQRFEVARVRKTSPGVLKIVDLLFPRLPIQVIQTVVTGPLDELAYPSTYLFNPFFRHRAIPVRS